MKFLHLSDLHIGKRLIDFPLLEDQAAALADIIALAERERPDAVLIAGDIYDKTMPATEAVTVFDEFLSVLHAMGITVLLISGNHDSPERLSFGARIMQRNHIHIARVYDGTVTSVTLHDAHGPIHFYLLPFIKPSHVRRFHETEIETYTDAVRAALNGLPTSPNERNVLLAHQFVTGAMTSDSEDINVGGLDNVDASVFNVFDYTALGHLHSPQNVGRETVRYCGTMLKYSFSELRQTKSVTIVALGAKGNIAISAAPLTPLHEMRAIKGTYAELTALQYYDGTSLPTDYLHITLTDEFDVPEAVGKLRTIYHNLMKLDYDNPRTRAGASHNAPIPAARQTPLEVFTAFYETQNGQPMTMAQHALMRRLIEEGADAPCGLSN